MAISIPSVPVYYYECSDGKFRLTYFIPFKKLEELANHKKIDPEVLLDFPDGLDLDCTEPDYTEFEELYKYRPNYSPEMLWNSFLAIFSSTKSWKNYRGTGYIHAKDLESYISQIETDLENENLTKDVIPTLPPEASYSSRKSRMMKRLNLQSKTERYLHRYNISSIDKKKNLNEQKLTRIRMDEGEEETKEFFSRVQLKQKLKND